MFQIIHGYHQEDGKDGGIVGISDSKSYCVVKENILEFQKKQGKQNSGDKFNNRVLDGNAILAPFASALQKQKTKNWNELIPNKLPLASHTPASAPEGPMRIVSENNHIQKTANDKT